MEFRYLPMTNQDKQEMLDAIGIKSTEELFSDIPEHVRFKGEMNLKAPISEYELTKELTELASRNIHTKEYTSFLGAGVYDHYIPSVVDHVISRSEFYTAYTPYQPEISQGELQAIFEFQTMISELTGLPVANSSMYDGGTALAEAVNLSAAHTKRKKVLVSKAVHPEYRAVIDSYTRGQSIDIVEIDTVNGVTDLAQLDQAIDETIAGVVVQYPNFFGQLEPMKKIEQLLENHQKTMLIVSSNPLALGYLTPPGEFGADIVTGDTQVFGIPAQFGGPHCGYFATSKKLMRKVPGRLVGETVDEEGTRGYVLTLQAREQHIRRDKATSNICSNQALNALASSVAMSSIGKHGLRKLASVNMQKARYARKKLLEAGVELAFDGSFFNEFVIKVPGSVSKINKQLLDKGIIAGYDLAKDDKSLEGYMLIAVTEVRTKQEIDQFVKELGDIHV
ncbi:glycine dehydrogenase subunit 1 (glycine cleavage system P-protein) [Oceanobacillus iheyensis HTE831]|uniref:Probable glycine dehydrogenase (decarboxylating) subunit 1 n=1 Tax=Oceanobacillus iheyensis (strain DSM 14371 / CIP 107618 / JCM 11309 / KCTC 3954 / HTE831) TaxID=221109 RepID=GCSPA_OCEIH|nr:aminomethyl-transferring glycine dehydrogenase subunit GcvPA [Oceanobacillus iheyensis]Q8CXE0.1 RecName: Full=Probable glycine dehydrogenase (decarboxylating) subunit 1; AltName: Full=Glycine cleavage system P-protein subunit 1; AltName: Full=Glycine decarboxylase subunit 1; AltName: Full=Glycine dehydrogenase (aminomethyl-transferring) subunit 1 [Oceanobacillus iheyensis HTE831]BAC13859.1 glycine dehydrogenase subunit 1 (glycine cleavage system P-protein) [Oceanobacillus iheyensis HTE831]